MDRALAISLSLLGLAGCSACSDESRNLPGDAAPDGSGRESSIDARVDDSGLDSSVDGGTTWYPEGEWDQPFVDRGCSARVARDANAAISAWSYQACQGGAEGCEEALQDWQQGPSTYHPLTAGWHPVRIANGKTILLYRRYYPRSLATDVWALVDVVQELDGARILAVGDSLYGNPSPCTAQLPTTVDGVGWWLTRSGNGGFLGGFASWLSPKNPIPLRDYAPSQLGGSGASVNEWAAGRSSLFLGVVSPMNIVTIAPNDGGIAQPSSVPIVVEGMTEVPDGVIGVTAGPYGIRLVRRDATSAVLHAPAGAAVVNGLAYDATTNRVVWQEAIAGQNGWTDGKIFTASYATTTITPSLLTNVPTDYDYIRGFVANAGSVVLSRKTTEARVVRIVDGMGWDISGPEGRVTVAPLWVDDGHVWFFTGDGKAKNPQVTGIWRQSRAAWGPPTVPPSL